jgi:lipopolysaccharide transport system permease protein
MEPQTETWIRITPRGIRQSHMTLAQWWRGLSDDVARARHIVSAELRARVFDKSLGWAWLLLEPLMMSGIYYFVTAVIFSLRSTEVHRFVSILTALIFFRWFSKPVDVAPAMMTSYAGVLKGTNFPVRVLFMSFLGTETVLFAMNLAVLFPFLFVFGCYPSLSYVALPLVMLPILLMTATASAVLGIAGTFVKDLMGIVYAFTAVLWYVSPGMYPVELVQQNAPHYMWLYRLNPFAHLLPALQSILVDGQFPGLGVPLLISAIMIPPLALAFHVFGRARYYYFKFL